ncbi:putative Protein kinase domain containing protein [Monocercomonoides exilis]|uniref:putative Protein kinase domain containing protein n=1 Tax=Monocercomonoides exilis TaxID=2049356 RepID=UPI003559F817|nr:putative Protein kinase domain containing protein [Monocercomonoides exilis]|eukprot:MONOS_4476.1-p1 / transcript=MONOS_4476.1 / gene=MONOS_4476 / organism=Monocercomonoides_exilis_PA203 / gene_product=Protein kinase domain containing protein / transcript_product=Protein kinase domain containing protein / location=Mono_scaffold00119:73988-78442(+) / protein_length=1462 / sequence_SO=supercontig / SO=protein_coding / is_pseudo=false
MLCSEAFTFLDEIGHGAYGTVLKALYSPEHVMHESVNVSWCRKSSWEDLFPGNIYAVKKIHMNLDKIKDVARAQKEASIMLKLRHPFLVACFGAFIEKSDLFLIMEYVEEGNLEQFVLKRKEKRNLLSRGELLRISWEICSGVAYLHQNNIVHRDLKSSNILLSKNLTVKIGDFGSSRAISSSDSLMTTHAGTPLYMAPEVLVKEKYTCKCDVWSVGCLLYLLSVLEHPFASTNYSMLLDRVFHTVPRSLIEHYAFRTNYGGFNCSTKKLEKLSERKQNDKLSESKANSIQSTSKHPEEQKQPTRNSSKEIKKALWEQEKQLYLRIISERVPSSLGRMVMKCLEKDERNRPAIKEVLEGVFDRCVDDDDDENEDNVFEKEEENNKEKEEKKAIKQKSQKEEKKRKTKEKKSKANRISASPSAASLPHQSQSHLSEVRRIGVLDGIVPQTVKEEVTRLTFGISNEVANESGREQKTNCSGASSSSAMAFTNSISSSSSSYSSAVAPNKTSFKQNATSETLSSFSLKPQSPSLLFDKQDKEKEKFKEKEKEKEITRRSISFRRPSRFQKNEPFRRSHSQEINKRRRKASRTKGAKEGEGKSNVNDRRAHSVDGRRKKKGTSNYLDNADVADGFLSRSGKEVADRKSSKTREDLKSNEKLHLTSAQTFSISFPSPSLSSPISIKTTPKIKQQSKSSQFEYSSDLMEYLTNPHQPFIPLLLFPSLLYSFDNSNEEEEEEEEEEKEEEMNEMDGREEEKHLEKENEQNCGKQKDVNVNKELFEERENEETKAEVKKDSNADSQHIQTLFSTPNTLIPSRSSSSHSSSHSPPPPSSSPLLIPSNSCSPRILTPRSSSALSSASSFPSPFSAAQTVLSDQNSPSSISLNKSSVPSSISANPSSPSTSSSPSSSPSSSTPSLSPSSENHPVISPRSSDSKAPISPNPSSSHLPSQSPTFRARPMPSYYRSMFPSHPPSFQRASFSFEGKKPISNASPHSSVPNAFSLSPPTSSLIQPQMNYTPFVFKADESNKLQKRSFSQLPLPQSTSISTETLVFPRPPSSAFLRPTNSSASSPFAISSSSSSFSFSFSSPSPSPSPSSAFPSSNQSPLAIPSFFPPPFTINPKPPSNPLILSPNSSFASFGRPTPRQHKHDKSASFSFSSSSSSSSSQQPLFHQLSASAFPFRSLRITAPPSAPAVPSVHSSSSSSAAAASSSSSSHSSYSPQTSSSPSPSPYFVSTLNVSPATSPSSPSPPPSSSSSSSSSPSSITSSSVIPIALKNPPMEIQPSSFEDEADETRKHYSPVQSLAFSPTLLHPERKVIQEDKDLQAMLLNIEDDDQINSEREQKDRNIPFSSRSAASSPSASVLSSMRQSFPSKSVSFNFDTHQTKPSSARSNSNASSPRSAFHFPPSSSAYTFSASSFPFTSSPFASPFAPPFSSPFQSPFSVVSSHSHKRYVSHPACSKNFQGG